MQPSDIFRIYITTDTHLGFKERVPTRANDTFNALEEGLLIARKLKCDFVLHGGDLFDVQRPTQATLWRGMSILRKHVYGPDPIRFTAEWMPEEDGEEKHTSDPPEGRSPSSPKPRMGQKRQTFNFQSKALNVALPIFAIHGNHDPPASHDGTETIVSAVDLLETCGLINDIGKIDDFDKIEIVPVLLQKGTSKLAIYGIGHIRDERMHRIFTLGKIEFIQAQPTEEYFNILLIHQNRFKGPTGGAPAKGSVHEGMLPNFFDLVIWGHEHDCFIDPADSLEGGYHILQPGSTVVTSLSKGEATFKRNAVVEVCGRQFRLHSFPLLTTRPYIFDEVAAEELCPLEKQDQLWNKLEGKVNDLLKTVDGWVQERDENWSKCVGALLDELQGNDYKEGAAGSHYDQNRLVTIASDAVAPADAKKKFLARLREKILAIGAKDQMMPLVRLRVDLSGGFEADFSIGRFGSAYIDKIANADEILLFHKARAAPGTARSKTGVTTRPITSIPDIEIRKTETQEEIHDMIFCHLSEGSSLELLHETELNEAVKHYVARSDTGALEKTVAATVSDLQKRLKRLKRDQPNVDIEEAIKLLCIQKRATMDAAAAPTQADETDPMQGPGPTQDIDFLATTTSAQRDGIMEGPAPESTKPSRSRRPRPDPIADVGAESDLEELGDSPDLHVGSRRVPSVRGKVPSTAAKPLDSSQTLSHHGQPGSKRLKTATGVATSGGSGGTPSSRALYSVGLSDASDDEEGTEAIENFQPTLNRPGPSRTGRSGIGNVTDEVLSQDLGEDIDLDYLEQELENKGPATRNVGKSPRRPSCLDEVGTDESDVDLDMLSGKTKPAGRGRGRGRGATAKAAASTRRKAAAPAAKSLASLVSRRKRGNVVDD